LKWLDVMNCEARQGGVISGGVQWEIDIIQSGDQVNTTIKQTWFALSP
jgi:hypothetical protein